MSEENEQTPKKKYYDYISVGNRTPQRAYFVQQHDKNKMFEELLKEMNDKQTLVIVKSKRGADSLMEYLKAQGINSISIHGNHRASQIVDAQTAFNAKKTAILITTDRIFETMTLEDTRLLINYDLPIDAPDYFLRLRQVDEVGESISLIDPEDENMLATVELMMKCEMKEVEIKGFEHTNRVQSRPKDKTKKPRHQKVKQRAKRIAEIKSKWIPTKDVK